MIEDTSNSDFNVKRSKFDIQTQRRDFSPAEDHSSDVEKLEKYSGDVEWNYLQPHYEAGAMIYVDSELELQEAGLAFAEDNKDQVQAWIKSGHLVQPCDLHVEHWKETKTRFNAMIVRPFVLAQPIQS